MKLSTACRLLFWEYMDGKISLEELDTKVEAVSQRQGNLFKTGEGINGRK